MSDIDVSVCIIGAGISGLKAAQSLLTRSSFTADDLIILEAQERVGGRIFTDRTSSKIGLPYDLGASWFHDCLSNVVFQHFLSGKDNDVFDVKKDGVFDDKPLNVYTSEGTLNQIESNISTILHDIETFCQLYFIDKFDTNDDLTLKDLVELYIEKYGPLLTAEELKIARVSMRYYELWHGISWDRLSARYAVLEHNGRDLFNRKGNDILIDFILREVPKGRILLNHAVKEINRDAKKQYKRNISVVTHNGVRINCDYLLVTVPQSILALNHEKEPKYGIKWSPPLPASITSALTRIHFGALGKVIFEFDSVWWDKDVDRFSIHSDSGVATDGIETLTTLPKSFSFPALAINGSKIHSDKTNKGSLVILTQSPLTEYLERHPSEAWEYFKPMLQQISTSTEPAPNPINTITTKWTINPYIRGSYAGCHKGDEPSEIISLLSGDIEGMGLSSSTVRFAGEHTTYEGEGCIHGAWMSGEREAKWISDHAGKTETKSRL